jgi:UDP-N-acetyl-D-galactosamine dehydrogenase
MQDNNSTNKIAIIGIGYVGLPLAVAFAKKKRVVAFDIDNLRIDELRNGYDRTGEILDQNLINNENLKYTCSVNDLVDVKNFIVSVPTPLGINKEPDLDPLKRASEIVGSVLTKGSLIVYESTVYPGATEEICIPILEEFSKLKLNNDFFVGYSPERINPGDTSKTLKDIVKVVSGSNEFALQLVSELYFEIIEAGIHKVSSIKIAEAAKIIENTQRDLNIALVNELSIIFDKLGIDTLEVINAAATKWNFQRYVPGLVGGHCIGVDPYYLTYKAQTLGYDPKIILAGRELNDNMSEFITKKFFSYLIDNELKIKGSRCLILGITFKENCPDIRNTGVINLIRLVNSHGIETVVVDPWASPIEVKNSYGIDLVTLDDLLPDSIDHVIVAVAHRQFTKLAKKLRSLVGHGVIFDLKSILESEDVDLKL